MRADFVHVRKGKGRVHLAVRFAPDEAVETLCDKHFGPGEIAAVEVDADCQACQRRQGDPGRVSSAFFEGGRGGALLELSLQQARERRSGDLQRLEGESASAETRPPRPSPRQPPRLTIVPSERPVRTIGPAAAGPAPAPARRAEPVEPPEPHPTDLPRGLYRTPAGVVIRVGGHTERPRLERRRGDRVRMLAGDVEVDVPPG